MADSLKKFYPCTYPDGRLNTAAAAAYLGVSTKTLAHWRCKGIGPAYVKRGRISYYQADLDAWLREGRWRSTAQQLRHQHTETVAA